MVNYLSDNLDQVFAALADPTRIRIAEALSSGEKSLSDLAEPFNMTMPAVMKHLAVMEKGGILHTEKRGRTRYCRLNAEGLEAAQTWLEQRSRMWSERLNALERYLEENP
jgi:DNA-binding transcriptional ArsR family regulator